MMAAKQTSNSSRVHERKAKLKTPKASRTKNQHNVSSTKTNCKGGDYDWSKLSFVGIFIIAATCGCLNWYHQSTMFENDRHFSHLSALEREMTFRTEMGLYYSYFKTIIEAPSLWTGLHSIMNDNLTEYPTVINTLKRFNLYPEVVLGTGYRIFQGITQYFNISTKECWEVMRGDELPSVESCEGLGEPSYFYVTSVFAWNSLVPAILFLYGMSLSNSVLGGILAVACFFFNHGECTRVQWTPPLRESFAYPIFLTQMFVISLSLRSNQPGWKLFIATVTLTSAAMLSWQFAQFVFLIQTLSVFVIYTLGFITAIVLQRILQGQMMGLAVSLLLLMGNEMLLASFFASSLLVSYLICMADGYLSRIGGRPVVTVCQLFLFLCGSLGLKAIFSLVLNVQDDAHIWNILRSKFTNYSDFHTLLYTCAAEFDFMEKETPVRLLKTLLLPSVVVVVITVLFQIWKKSKNIVTKQAYESAEVLYALFHLAAFAVMAILIMRLKLFFTPQLCLISSLLLSRKYFSWIRTYEVHFGAAAVLVSIMAFQGIQNIQSQRNIIGEYSNPPLEELISWINASTPPDAVFAGAMPTMANLMLSTRRPIVNHPHYEDANLRERCRRVYMLYSRKSSEEVYNVLSEMEVNYAVLEKNWCFGKRREGCGMVDVWDVEDPSNRGKESLCQKLIKNPAPFKGVFHNLAYAVLQVQQNQHS